MTRPLAHSLFLVTTTALGALVTPVGASADGTLDRTFGTNGTSIIWFDVGGDFGDVVKDAVLQPDDRIVAVGWAEVGADDSDFVVARFQADGLLDSSFGSGGKVRLPIDLVPGGADVGTSVALQPDGKILVGGYTSGGGTLNDFDWVVVRLLPNGDVDTGFGSGGKVVVSFDFGGFHFDFVERVLVMPNGKIVVVGNVDVATGVREVAVVRLTPSGALDGTFDGDGKAFYTFGGDQTVSRQAEDAVVQPDGKVVVAGWADQGASNRDFAVLRILSSGALDTTFADDGRKIIPIDLVPGGQDTLNGVALDETGRILLTGSARAPTVANRDYTVVRLSPTGVLDGSLSGSGLAQAPVAGGDGSDDSVDLAVDSCGRILMAGWSDVVLGNQDFGVARIHPGGAVDSSFGTGGGTLVAYDLGQDNKDRVSRILLDSRGRPLLVGSIQRAGAGDWDWAVARLTGGLCLFLDGFETGNTSAWSATR